MHSMLNPKISISVAKSMFLVNSRRLSQRVVVISGMTGIGKTDLTQELWDNINGEVIWADASQIYQGLDVLTNKYMPQGGKQPHLMGYWDHVNKATSSRYALEWRKIIKDVISRGKTPILEGGSGFYIQSVFNRSLLTPQPGFDEIKEKAYEILKSEEFSFKILEKYDPENLLGVTQQFSEYK